MIKMTKMTKSRANLIDGIVFLVVALGLFAYAIISFNAGFNKDWAQSPSLFPLIVSFMIGFLSVALILQSLRRVKLETGFEDAAEVGDVRKKTNLKGVAIVFAIISIYYAVLSLVKIPIVTIMIYSLAITLSIFEVATILLLVVLMWYLGVRKASVLVLTPVLSTLFISIAFRSMLHVLLP